MILFFATFCGLQAQGITVIKIKVQLANVRSEPDMNATIIKQLKSGTLLEASQKLGDWFEITVQADQGKAVFGYISQSVVYSVHISAPPIDSSGTEDIIKNLKPLKHGEEEIGYAWLTPGTDWKPSKEIQGKELIMANYEASIQKLELETGAMSRELVNLVLKQLPFDMSVVDENDTVVYYSDTPDRIFSRSPAVIGRKVQNCHPPASVHVVTKILEAFRAGKKDEAEFWIQMGGKFILIRYLAVRDQNGAYKGCLEVSQDVTSIRRLEGQKRLLDWE